ncbi:MAG TPA: TolC family protein [Candidatus Binataceae bacterium]|nr:TolC family protein [Candidatus Binataceae bacterium]
MRPKSQRVVVLIALSALMLIGAGPATSPSGSLYYPGMKPPPAPPSNIYVPGASLPPVTNGPIPLSAQPISPQTAPDMSVPPEENHPFEHKDWAPEVLIKQWSPVSKIPPESVISERYLQTRDIRARALTLKEAVYIALSGNPGVQAARLDPVSSLESVRQSWAVFDPDLTAYGDVTKDVTPVTNLLQAGAKTSFVQKNYDWNFGIDKVLATTNGTLGLNFTNNYLNTNSGFAGLNPAYTTGLVMSLSQPLMQSFGLDFATINVRIAETNQKQSQFGYEQQLNDFVLRVGTDYWNVVRAEENLQVARDSLKLNQDLVRQNEISYRVGVLAPVDVQEALSEEATAEASVYQAEGALQSARVVLREDVMLNPARTFLPQQIEPADVPHPDEVPIDEEESLELAMEYRPELAALRESIRAMLLQVRYEENQTLPQVTLGSQFGLSANAGNVKCLPLSNAFGGAMASNCTAEAVPTPVPGAELPFSGVYNDALNRLWRFTWYNYAITLNIQQPLMNDAAKAALAQAKIQYEQQRLNYRNTLSQIVVDVETSLANMISNYKQARATRVATEYAAKSFRDEQERFRVGMASTHELLQYQDSLVSAQGSQVQAEVDFEISKLATRHAEGTLLRGFNVNFEATNPDVKPWYGNF